MKSYIKFEDWHIDKLTSAKDAQKYRQLAVEEYEADYNLTAFLLAISDISKAQSR